MASFAAVALLLQCGFETGPKLTTITDKCLFRIQMRQISDRLATA